jgi:hypothetical protein
MLWMCSQVLGLIFLIVMDALRDDNGVPAGNMRKSLIFCACFGLSISVLTTAYNSPNRRLDFEERNKGPN